MPALAIWHGRFCYMDPRHTMLAAEPVKIANNSFIIEKNK
jgi:hypothetical protein